MVVIEKRARKAQRLFRAFNEFDQCACDGALYCGNSENEKRHHGQSDITGELATIVFDCSHMPSSAS